MTLKKPLLILLAGFQGSGKTTLAQKLVDAYGLKLISPDVTRQKLFDRGVKFSEGFAKLVDNTRDEQIQEAIQSGQSAVVDTNVVPARIAKIKKGLENQNYKLITVFLDAPRAVLAQRVGNRPQLEGVYRGTGAELEASITTHCNITKRDYDIVINTWKNSPEKTFQTAAKKIDKSIL